MRLTQQTNKAGYTTPKPLGRLIATPSSVEVTHVQNQPQKINPPKKKL
jgi:hypothetical protein